MNVLFSYVVTEQVQQRFNDAERHRARFGYHHRILITDFNHHESINIGKREGPFCISRFRNAAIDYAIRQGYELLVIGDVDSVFITETLNPNTIYSTALVAHLEQGDTPFFIRHRTTPDIPLRPCSWFILHRSIFTKYRFSEEYKGYGFEDLDFARRLAKDGIKQGPFSLLAYHLWHPINVAPAEYHRNKNLYDSTTPG